MNAGDTERSLILKEAESASANVFPVPKQFPSICTVCVFWFVNVLTETILGVVQAVPLSVGLPEPLSVGLPEPLSVGLPEPLSVGLPEPLLG